jgi:hypothetical protein
MSTPLTLTHLRFHLIARSPINLGGHQAGERLRDALASVMLRAICPETRRGQKPSPEHAAVCPACWLLAADVNPGEVRRVYSLVPPHPAVELVEPGERFSFVLTLFGQGFQYLPYFVLAVPEMGRVGVGPGRGRFDLESIQALNPLAGEVQAVLEAGENVVRVPDGRIDWETALTAARALYPALEENGGNLSLQFLTPTRLIESRALVKTPDFGVFFQRLLQRIDQLAQQHAGDQRRSPEQIESLHALADRVRMVDAQMAWVDIWGPSGRTGNRTPLGGFVGSATYRARDWEPLLPWLLLGQGVQVGKVTVKGNGVFQIILPGIPGYWEPLPIESPRRRQACLSSNI